jgi:hypothetical protein
MIYAVARFSSSSAPLFCLTGPRRWATSDLAALILMRSFPPAFPPDRAFIQQVTIS